MHILEEHDQNPYHNMPKKSQHAQNPYHSMPKKPQHAQKPLSQHAQKNEVILTRWAMSSKSKSWAPIVNLELQMWTVS